MQYIVKESNIKLRKKFYWEITNNFNLKVLMPITKYYYSVFPFVVDFDDESFWVCESITCCAAEAQNNRIITIKEFFKCIDK